MRLVKHERKTDTFHAGKIRSRYIFEVPAYYGSGSSADFFYFYWKNIWHYFLYTGLDSDYLLLFPDVFKECDKTVRRESGIPGKDRRDTRFFQESESNVEAEKNAPYL